MDSPQHRFSRALSTLPKGKSAVLHGRYSCVAIDGGFVTLAKRPTMTVRVESMTADATASESEPAELAKLLPGERRFALLGYQLKLDQLSAGAGLTPEDRRTKAIKAGYFRACGFWLLPIGATALAGGLFFSFGLTLIAIVLWAVSLVCLVPYLIRFIQGTRYKP